MTCLTDTAARRDSLHGSLLSGSGRPRPRVLLVDDEPHVLEGVRAALRSQRYEIQTAPRADVALDMQREHPFDVIVADECMPGMLGSELLTVVALEFPSVGRVMLTGRAAVEAAARVINHAGVVRFLLKPCAPKDLHEAIEAALQASSPAATVRSPARRWSPTGHPARPATRRPVAPETPELELRDAAEEPVVRAESASREAEYWQSAMAKNELLLHAQEIVALDDPIAVYGYELLARVRMQGGPILRLSEFVSGARDPVRVPAPDRWVIQHIARMIDGCGRKPGRLGLTLLLNVSPQSVSDEDFVHFLGAQLRASGIAERVLLEIPEGPAVALAGSSSDGRLLRSFHNSGCRLCIDGVGPDLKRLATLQQLPVGLMKIDADLIHSALASSRAEAAVRSVMEFARAAGIATAAKCVETTAMAQQLRMLGVERGMGYAFGPPEPLGHVLANL